MNGQSKSYTAEQLRDAKVRFEIHFSHTDMDDWDMKILPLARKHKAYGDTRIYATLKSGREVRFYGFWVNEQFHMKPLQSKDGHREIVIHRNDYIRLLKAATVVNWHCQPVDNLTQAVIDEHINDEVSYIEKMH